MIYSKRKETSPFNTVNRIKKIFERIGLTPFEEVFQERKTSNKYISTVKISLKWNKFITSGGKSTDKNYALASAYGEMTERIQNGYFVAFKAPDLKKITISDFLKSDALNYFLTNSHQEYNHLIDYIIDLCTCYSQKKYFNKKCIDTLPYKHLNTNTIKYLPVNLIRYNAHSTGCCAGNTKEEAIIEGLCEIFERYVNKQIITDNISLPDIPEEIYLKYDEIKEITEYIKSLNFTLRIKDASLGGKFPVVCIILSKGKYEYIHFGSHPSLPIAIERAFTETFQGYDISNEKVIPYVFRNTEKQYNNLIPAKVDNGLYFKFIEPNKNFHKEPPLFDYNYKNIDCPSFKTNSILLKEMIQKYIQNYNIFIRDISFLGFNSYSIYIPELMNKKNINIEDTKKQFNYFKCHTIFNANLKTDIKNQEFLDFCEYNFSLKKQGNNYYKNAELFYISALIADKQFDKAITICRKIRNKKSKKLINFIEESILLKKENCSENKIRIMQKEKYGKYTSKILSKFFINKDGLKNTIQLIKRNKSRQNRLQNTKDAAKRMKNLQVRINKEYKRNCPNQSEIII